MTHSDHENSILREQNGPISRSRYRREAALIFCLGLIVRILFVQIYPATYGGDSVMRLMNTDKILIAYQLPLLQLLLYLTNLAWNDPLAFRYLMILLGAAAGAGFYQLSWVLLGNEVAFLASLLFVFNPFILVHSIVPYQEILMLLTAAFGFYYLFQGEARLNLWKVSLFFGLASLTRYEAWILAVVAAVYYVAHQARARNLRSDWGLVFKAVLIFGWAPVLWILFHGRLSQLGTLVVEAPSDFSRFYRILYVLGMGCYFFVKSDSGRVLNFTCFSWQPHYCC